MVLALYLIPDLEESPYIGCFREFPANRELMHLQNSKQLMTIIDCIAECKSENTPLAAVNVG